MLKMNSYKCAKTDFEIVTKPKADRLIHGLVVTVDVSWPWSLDVDSNPRSRKKTR